MWVRRCAFRKCVEIDVHDENADGVVVAIWTGFVVIAVVVAVVDMLGADEGNEEHSVVVGTGK